MSIANEIKAKGIFGRVVAFFDDDPEKIGKKVNGIPILGPLSDIIELINPGADDEALIAIPSASQELIKDIHITLREAHFSRIKILPQISQIIEGDAHLIQARELNPEDLLARDPVRVSLIESLRYVKEKRVLISGAGGSIGSELSRQLIHGGAERLYLFGHGENSIYELLKELKLLQEEGVGEKATIVPIIGELQDKEYMRFLIKRLKADIIFHTAAHKHVSLLEGNPVEAVKNNVFGTKNLIDAAKEAGSSKFILISTDKAVEPQSVYGASKLLAEEIILNERKNGLKYLIVRFGNVLGSRGSILPIFTRQILKGGPVTVTHPQARRFFMTIPEAASLVLKTAGLGLEGEMFVLDMGKPINIKELAEQLIRFYGFTPDSEIKIKYTQLFPGEKLEERLFGDNEILEKTEFPKIFRLRRKSILETDINTILEKLRPIVFFNPSFPELFRNRKELKKILKEAIPGFGMVDNEPEY
ncbi:MAG: polysaccharide biosynthesis protein [Spirochaetales bacterium]|nr:polysaccharide biosynthesis protein [Spirochaetales bacterium]